MQCVEVEYHQSCGAKRKHIPATMNHLKTFMNKVGDRVREVAPQGSPNVIDGTDPKVDPVEGFLCPSCFSSFGSPETLELHYSEEHLDPAANYLCPVCQARLSSQADLELHYTSNHKENDFNDKNLDALREELIEVSTNLREERWYSEELKREVERFQQAFQKKEDDGSGIYVHKTQLDAVEESKNLLSSEVVLLRKQLSEALQLTGILRRERASFEQRASELAVEKANFKALLDSIQTEKANVEYELQQAKNELVTEEQKYKEEIGVLSQNRNRFQEMVHTQSKEIEAQKEYGNNLQKNLKIKIEAVASLKEEMRDFKLEIDLMKKRHEEKCTEAENLVTLVTEKEAQLAQLTSQDQKSTAKSPDNLSPHAEKLQEDWEIEIIEMNEQLKKLNSQLINAERAKIHAEDLALEKLKIIDDISEKVTTVTNYFNEAKTKLVHMESLLKDRDKNIEDLKDITRQMDELKFSLKIQQDLTAAIEEKCQLQASELSSSALQIAKLELNLEQIRENEQCLIIACDAQKADLETIQNEMSRNLKEHEHLEEQYNEIFSKNCKLDTELSSLSLEKEKLLSQIEISKAVKGTLQSELEECKGSIVHIQNDLEVSIRQKGEFEIIIDDLRKARLDDEDRFTLSIKGLDTKIVDSEQNNLNILEEKASIEILLSAKTDEHDKLELELEKCEHKFSNLQQDLENRIENLTKVQTELTQKEGEILVFQKAQEEFDEQIAALNTKLHAKEEQRLKDSSLLTDLEGKLANVEAESAGLAGDKLELEVKLEAADEEQQSLLNRCLSSESEVERLQQQLTQLRRKLEDSIAGLHELGRENQSLQIETTKLAGRKWVEDSEVPNCSACEKSFSMTIRRHHCRNCGQIFCNDCSSKHAPVESNKRAVRVCDNCHAEILAKM